MPHYDVVVIGAGSGNTIVDARFDDRRVAFIERGPFGGTCLNRGCIPSKMFVHPADIAVDARHGPAVGVSTSFDGVDWPSIRERIFTRIDALADGGRSYREGLANVDVYTGDGRFTGLRELSVALDSGEHAEVTADQVVIAVGGRPMVPAIPGLAAVEHHTSDTIMRLDSFPGRLAVIGGGYVGSEFAHVFSAYGAQVTQLARGPQLLGSHDADIAARFTDIASTQWGVRLGVQVTRAVKVETGIALHLDDGTTLEVDVVLVATGRVPNSDQLDLDRAGVDVHPDGRVVVDEHQRTSAPGVWALGDISSPEPLKHVANQDARVVQHNLLAVLDGGPDGAVGDLQVSDHRFVPNAVFTSPQVAAVGLTEAEARGQGIDLAVGTHEYADVAFGWALADQADGCFVKLLADRATGLLVGAHVIGQQASIIVQPVIQAMSFGQPVAGLARGQYWIHPALTEVLENALLALESELAGPGGP